MGQDSTLVAERPAAIPENRYKTPPGMRNIRVTVPEEVFFQLHDMANASRMRFIPYMRRFLKKAWPYPPSGEST